MKSREVQHATIERVQAAFARWPRFEDMPEGKAGDARTRVKRTPDEFGDPVITQKSYVEALFSLSYDDAEPVGRDGDFIVGNAVD